MEENNNKNSIMENVIKIYNEKISQGKHNALMSISHYLHFEEQMDDETIEIIMDLFNT